MKLRNFMIFVILMLSSTLANAANRTVCFELVMRDDRYECAESSSTGERRACNPGNYTYMVGARVQLWDKDSGGSASDE